MKHANLTTWAAQFRVELIGDYNPSAIAHQAIPEALRLSADTGDSVDAVWVHTGSISNAQAPLRDFDGGWCVPSPLSFRLIDPKLPLPFVDKDMYLR